MLADRVRMALPKGTKWPDANGYIYNEGEHEDMWEVGFEWDWDKWYKQEGWGEWEWIADKYQSKEEDHLLLEHVRTTTAEDAPVNTWVNTNPVDVTNYDLLKLDVNAVGFSELGIPPLEYIKVYVLTDKEDAFYGHPNNGGCFPVNPELASLSQQFGRDETQIPGALVPDGIITLDLSEIIGKVYIHIQLDVYGGVDYEEPPYTTTLKINKVWLE